MRHAQFALVVSLLVGCSTGSDEVAGTPSFVDTGVDSGADGSIGDVAPEVASDTAIADSASDASDASGPCKSATDCTTSAAGPVCDTTTGRCVACNATSDVCPPSEHCDLSTSKCVPGCKSDEGCVLTGGDAGTDGAVSVKNRCDVTTRTCVQCTRDDHCAAGFLCSGNVCSAGCSSTRPCPTGESCCSGSCVDLQTNVDHCAACDTKCSVTGGTAACTGGTCGVGACSSPLADCDKSYANGCEADLTSAAHCGSCGNACATGSLCVGGTCSTTLSCQDLLTKRPGTPSGTYTIDPDGALGANAPFDVYCDMTSEGGGWTLVMKLDGAQLTFQYASAYWTNTATFNPTSTDLSQTEAKLASFHLLAGTELRLGMVDAGTARYVRMPLGASTTLLDRLSGAFTATALGRAAWSSLLASPSLQANCNREGTNNSVPSYAAVRIGIVTNQEGDCGSPDSFIGFGASPNQACFPSVTTTTGNVAFCGAESGDRNTATFGYVFIR